MACSVIRGGRSTFPPFRPETLCVQARAKVRVVLHGWWVGAGSVAADKGRPNAH
jgi:hypothetical protein